MKNFKKTTLRNGLRIVTVPMKDNDTVTVMVVVEAGSNYENKDINGISHFLEHVCFKGTEKRPSSALINHELDAMGSQSNAFTGNEYTGYYAKAHHSKTENLVDIVSDIYLNSTLPAGEIEKEKGVIIEEINMYEDLPQRKVVDVYENLLYAGTAAGLTILGPRENIQKMKREDFEKYREKHYVSGATTVVVAGKMNEKKVVKQIEKLFAGIRKGKPVSLPKLSFVQKKPQIKIFHKDTDQTHLIVGFRGYPRGDKRNTTLALLSVVLGGGMSSRLFQKMREELGICYYVRSSKNSYRTHGDFSISAGVSNARVREAVEGILGEVKRMIKEKVSDAELRKAKDYSIGNMYLGLESSDSLADFYGFQELLHDKKIRTPEDMVKDIEKVKAADIQKLAKEIFKDETLNFAVVGPYKDEKEFEDILTIAN